MKSMVGCGWHHVEDQVLRRDASQATEGVQARWCRAPYVTSVLGASAGSGEGVNRNCQSAKWQDPMLPKVLSPARVGQEASRETEPARVCVCVQGVGGEGQQSAGLGLYHCGAGKCEIHRTS